MISALAGASGTPSSTRAATCRHRASLGEALADSGLYCFVSSVSVYADFTTVNDEESPVAQLGDLPADEVTHEGYGPLKALCEDAVRDVFGYRALVVRARPHRRPARPDRPVHVLAAPHRARRRGARAGAARGADQFVDVRDLGAWIVDLCARGVGGDVQRDAPGRDLGRAARHVPRGSRRATRRSPGSRPSSSSSTRSASGWSCRSGSSIRPWSTPIEWTSDRALAAGSRVPPARGDRPWHARARLRRPRRRGSTGARGGAPRAWHGRG